MAEPTGMEKFDIETLSQNETASQNRMAQKTNKEMAETNVSESASHDRISAATAAIAHQRQRPQFLAILLAYYWSAGQIFLPESRFGSQRLPSWSQRFQLLFVLVGINSRSRPVPRNQCALEIEGGLAAKRRAWIFLYRRRAVSASASGHHVLCP